MFIKGKPLRVQVPNNHMLSQNQYYNHYSPNHKYLVIGYMEDNFGLHAFLGVIENLGLQGLQVFGGLSEWGGLRGLMDM